MTRIIAGRAKGARLVVPEQGTRPTSERVREAVFSRIEHLMDLEGARVIDLFAGSGALGLEALSRGAASAVLVEANRRAAEVCRRNVSTTGLAARVVAESAERWLAGSAGAAGAPGVADSSGVTDSREPARSDGFELALLDPPYDLDPDILAVVLVALDRHLAAGALVVVEQARRAPGPSWPRGWEPATSRRYGDTVVWFTGPAEPPELAEPQGTADTHGPAELGTAAEESPAGGKGGER